MHAWVKVLKAKENLLRIEHSSLGEGLQQISGNEGQPTNSTTSKLMRK